MAISTNGTVIARLAGGLYNQTLSNATYNEVVAVVKTAADISALANDLYARDFASKTDLAVATTLVSNLGLSSVAGLNNWVAAQLTSAGTAGKGAKIVSLLNDFANLTSDATYGSYAAAFNTKTEDALALSQKSGSTGGDFAAAATLAAAEAAAAAAKAAADTAAAEAAAAAAKAAADKVAADAAAAANAPQTFTLSANADASTGGAGNDIFNATHLTLTSGDSLVGGSGSDTLSIVDTGTSAMSFPSPVSISGIETIKIQNKNATGGSAGSTETATVTVGALKAGQTLVVAGQTLLATADLSASTVASALATADVASTDETGTGWVLSGDLATGWGKAAGTNSDQVVYTATTVGNKANLTITGSAQSSIKQANIITMGGTIDATDYYTVTINGVSVRTAVVSTTTAAAAATAVANAINAYIGTNVATAVGATVQTVSGTALSIGSFVDGVATSAATFSNTLAPSVQTIAVTATTASATATMTFTINGTAVTTAAVGADASTAATAIANAINTYYGAVIATTSTGTVTVNSGSVGLAISAPVASAGTYSYSLGTTTASSGLAATSASSISVTEGAASVAAGSGTDTLTATNFTDATSFVNEISTSDVTFASLSSAQSATIKGNNLITHGATTAGWGSTGSNPVLNIDGGVKGGNVSITSSATSIDSVTINSTGAPATSTGAIGTNTIGTLSVPGSATSTLAIHAASNLTTSTITASNKYITVDGAATLVTLGAITDSALTSVDASGMTAGGVKMTNLSTITSFKGGSGADEVTTAGTTAATAVIDGGAGSADKLVLAASNDVTTAAKGAQYVNFEKLKSLQTSSFNTSLVSGITSVETAAAGGGFTGLNAAQAANVTVSVSQASTGVTYALTDATGAADTLGLTFTNATSTTPSNATALTVTGFETVNLTASSGAKVVATGTAGTNYDSFAFAAAGSTKTIALKGAFAAKVDISSNATAVTALDASANSAAANLVTGGQVGALTVTGTTGEDTIAVGAVGTLGTVTVNGGDGNDAISVSTGYFTTDVSIEGGAGNDTVTYTAGSSQDMGVVKMSGVDNLALTLDGSNVLDVRNVTGLTALKVTSAASTNDITVSRMDPNTSLTFAGTTTTDQVVTTLQTGTSQKVAFTAASTVSNLTLDIGTTTLTVTADDGDTTANETMATFTDIDGTAWTTLVVLGNDAANVGTMENTVTLVDASASKGKLTVTAGNNIGTSILGSEAADSILGGTGADTLTGGKGADSLSGGDGHDTYVFANSGSNNGLDVLTITAGEGSNGDIMNFKNFLSGGSVSQNAGAGTAIVAYTSSNVLDVELNGKVAFYSNASEGDIDSTAEIAALIEGAGDAFSLASGGKAILFTGDAGSTSDSANIWFINDALDGVLGVVSATDVVNVGVIGTFDLDTFTTYNFAFA